MDHTDPRLVHVRGYRERLRLDTRKRFRLPDQLAGVLHEEAAAVRGRTDLPPSTAVRLGFYFVPGTGSRLFLYPPNNIQLAIDRFESPPEHLDIETVRAARNYFYDMMTFVEADRQNRLQVPDHLRGHAGIDEGIEEVLLTCHDLWLVLSPAPVVDARIPVEREAFAAGADDILDPRRRRETGSENDDPRGQEPSEQS